MDGRLIKRTKKMSLDDSYFSFSQNIIKRFRNMTKGIELIAEERKRQIEVEGYDVKHDFNNPLDSIVAAAISYAMVDIDEQRAKTWWNWDWKHWKPKDRKRNLVRAGALIAAALDKLQAQEDFEAWLKERGKHPHVSSKCVNDKTGEIIPWVPRARNIGDNHYHFEDCTEEEVIEFRKEYMRTGECLHKCGHDEGAFCMERAVCDICGESDLF